MASRTLGGAEKEEALKDNKRCPTCGLHKKTSKLEWGVFIALFMSMLFAGWYMAFDQAIKVAGQWPEFEYAKGLSIALMLACFTLAGTGAIIATVQKRRAIAKAGKGA